MSSETKDLESWAMKKQERKKRTVRISVSGIEKVAKRNCSVRSLELNFAIHGKQIGESVIHEILFGGA